MGPTKRNDKYSGFALWAPRYLYGAGGVSIAALLSFSPGVQPGG